MNTQILKNVNNIDVSCQTSAECVSLESEIEGLKTSQAVDREIILSLSDTVAQIAGFIKQFQEQNCSNSQVKSTPSYMQNISNEMRFALIMSLMVLEK